MRGLLFASVFASAVCAAGAVAQELPAALKDIPRASGACNRHTEDAADKNAPPLPELVADLRCAVSVPDLQNLMKQQNTVLFDVRAAGDYRAYHIEPSMPISFAELHAKPYWRKKAVVLIGNGKAEHELYGECTRLQQAGYQSVRVLRGGLPLWLWQQQPVSGAAPAAVQLVQLAAAEVWLEAQNEQNLVLLAPELAALREYLPFAAILPQPGGAAGNKSGNAAAAIVVSPAEIKAIIAKRHKESQGAPLASLVLAAPGINDAQIAQLQQVLLPLPLLVYRGSSQEFKQQYALQKNLWLARAKGPKQPGCGL